MDTSVSERFYRRPAIRAAMTGVSVVGLIVVVYAVSQPVERPSFEFGIGLLLLAWGLIDVVRPLYVVQSEGLLLARQGLKGMGVLITWPSIRELVAANPNELAIGLVDRSWIRLRLGTLLNADRERLVSLIGQYSVMVSKRFQRTA